MRPAVVLVVVALIAAACSVQVQQGIDVAEDETFDYTVDMRLSASGPMNFDEMGEGAQPDVDDMEQDLGEFASRLGARDHTVDQAVDGNELTMSVSLLGVPLQNAGRLADGGALGEEADDVAGDDNPMLSDLVITSDGGDYRVEATLASLEALERSSSVGPSSDGATPEGTGSEGATPDGEPGDDGPSFDMGQMADVDYESTLTLTLPGEVTDHNADEHDEDTGALTWQADSGAERQIRAASATGGGLLSSLAPAIAVVLIAGIAIGAVVLVRRKATARRSPPAWPTGPNPTP